MDAVAAGMHVLVTKPIVMTLAEHRALAAAAAAAGVLVAVEVHKRWDPIYADARERLRRLGDLSQMHAYMSQPKLQLETFRAWAGVSSDISYYLNSHHVDILAWALEGRARPESVVAAASRGVADALLRRPCEDTISLMSTWRNADGSAGHAVTTASWVAPTADCHTQQGLHYMGQGGEIRADQAHRGYSMSADAASGGTGALAALNPVRGGGRRGARRARAH
jgi:D-galacturonate reductase